MNSKSLSIALIAVFSIFLLANCSNSTSTSATNQSISFLDKGAVVPDPVSTLVTVNQQFVEYSTSKSGVVRNSWSSVISPDDFLRLMSIVDHFGLLDAPDPVLPQGVTGCTGGQGIRIVTTRDSRIDTLNISGLIECYRAYWPAGLDSLIQFEASIVNKYKPK